MKAACRHYRKCSGCTKLQFPYAKQVHDKDRAVREALGRFVGGPESTAFEPFGQSPLPLGYRASTKLCLNEDSFGQRTIGLYERGTKTVVDIPDCPVHHPAINKLVQRLLGGRAPLPAPFYNHAKRGFQPGRLKFVTVRVSPAGDAAGLVLSHTGVDRDALAAWAKNHGTAQLCIYESPLTRADDDRILSDAASHLAGAVDFPYRIGGGTFRLSPMAFFQANFSLTDAFIAHITEGLQGEALLDLYGGFGAYAFAAAPRFRQTWLVDGNASAIAAAAATNSEARISGLTPVHASIEDFLGRRLARADAGAVTHVIVNPPRAGLSPRVASLLGQATLPRLQQLVYVSCNVDTLSRDLGALTRGGGLAGLKVRSIRAFDMFPQTDHVEVVVKLARGR